MTDRAAFLAAICADPACDTARLVYADWLDEHDEPARAEFIRVQCEIAKRGWETGVSGSGGATAEPTHRCKVCEALWVLWPDDAGWSLCSPLCGKCCDNEKMLNQIAPLDAEERALLGRERALLSAHGRQWANEMIPEAGPSHWSPYCPTPYLVLPGGTFLNLAFRRGFVDSISCHCLDLIRFADRLLWSKWLPDRCRNCIDQSPDWETGVIECRRCDSTGFEDVRNPEPIPPGAHPITRVKLTQLPTAHVPEFNALRPWVHPVEWGWDIRDSIAAEWPWVQFDIPADTVVQ